MFLKVIAEIVSKSSNRSQSMYSQKSPPQTLSGDVPASSTYTPIFQNSFKEIRNVTNDKVNIMVLVSLLILISPLEIFSCITIPFAHNQNSCNYYDQVRCIHKQLPPFCHSHDCYKCAYCNNAVKHKECDSVYFALTIL